MPHQEWFDLFQNYLNFKNRNAEIHLFKFCLNLGLLDFRDLEWGPCFRKNPQTLAFEVSADRTFRKLPAFPQGQTGQEDLEATHWLLKQNYARYQLLKDAGTDWDKIFKDLEKNLLSNPNPPLTHHFQQKLMEALDFTEDPMLKSDLFLQKGIISGRWNPKRRFIVGQACASKRKTPGASDLNHAEVANHFLLNCLPKGEMMFRVIGDRSEEPRFMLGRLASSNEKPLDCLFENELGTPSRLQLPMVLNQGVRNQAKTTLPIDRRTHPLPDLVSGREGG